MEQTGSPTAATTAAAAASSCIGNWLGAKRHLTVRPSRTAGSEALQGVQKARFWHNVPPIHNTLG